MADLWQQFHTLPKSIRDGVSTPAVMAALDDLENTYPAVDVGNLLMRVVVREVRIQDVEPVLQKEYQLDAAAVKLIADRLRRDVFVGMIGEYLGIQTAPETAVQAPPIPKNLPVMTAQPATAKAVNPVQLVKVQPPLSSPPPPPTVPTLQPMSPVGNLAPTTHYSDADAAEIEQQVSKLHALNSPNQDFDTLARSILTAQNLGYSDELLDRRAVSIVKARLRDIRSMADTIGVLTRDPKVGGLGLDPEIANTLAAATDRAATEVKARGMTRPPEVPLPPIPPPVPVVTQSKPAPLPPFRRDAPPAPPFVPVNVTDAPRASRPIVRPPDIPVVAPTPPPPAKVPVLTTPPPIVTRARVADRPTVADIVRPSMTLGPAEELRSMTLIEFRRLGQGAADTAKKLLDKFQHLKRESFTVWSQALSGWRQSDIYQLYLAMGRESLEKGMPISQVIAERGRAGLPYLSEHEFSILVDMNRQLQI